MKRAMLIAIFLAPLALFANQLNQNQATTSKIVYLEALYGFGAMNFPQNGFIHEVQARAIFPTTDLTHELLVRGSFSQKTKSHNEPSKFTSYEAEYRLGMRMDEQLSSMGMILGSAYIGIGYQNVSQKYTARPNDNRSAHFLYIPIGFWGEDSFGEGDGIMSSFKMRYGINTKMLFMDSYNSEKKLKGHFLFGGKIYLGLGYRVADVLDLFVQAYFQYNAPIKNLRQYGFEAGLQF